MKSGCWEYREREPGVWESLPSHARKFERRGNRRKGGRGQWVEGTDSELHRARCPKNNGRKTMRQGNHIPVQKKKCKEGRGGIRRRQARKVHAREGM